MAQFYTLDEAADRLALSPAEFRRRLKEEWKDIRPFRDGATLRFRSNDIDELARSLGEMSDPSLQFPAFRADPPAEPEPAPTAQQPILPQPIEGANPELEDAPTREQSVLPEPPASSRKIARPAVPAKPSDSDIRVESPADDDSALSFGTDEMTVDLSGPGSAIARLGPPTSITGPKTSTRIPPLPPVKKPAAGLGKISAADQSSEFDLSLDADSDSFELQLGSDSGEFRVSPPAATPAPIALAPDVPPRGKQSGINLGKPADSGLSLERGGPLSDPKSGFMAKSGIGRTGMSDSSGGEFELSLDGPMSQGGSSASAASADSEFELTLDDDYSGASSEDGPKTGVLDPSDGQGDIFETDFDLPALDSSDDSDSEVVAVDESSGELALDTSDVLADDESASQVMLVDDEIAEDVVAVDDDVVAVEEVETDASASGAMRSYRADDDDSETYPAGAGGVVAAPAPWGAMPAAVLFLSLPLVFLGGLMSFELLRGMWGYHQPSKPGNMLVRGVADALGMKVSD